MRQHGIQIESWGPFAEGLNNLFPSRRRCDSSKSMTPVT